MAFLITSDMITYGSSGKGYERDLKNLKEEEFPLKKHGSMQTHVKDTGGYQSVPLCLSNIKTKTQRILG